VKENVEMFYLLLSRKKKKKMEKKGVQENLGILSREPCGDGA